MLMRKMAETPRAVDGCLKGSSSQTAEQISVSHSYVTTEMILHFNNVGFGMLESPERNRRK